MPKLVQLTLFLCLASLYTGCIGFPYDRYYVNIKPGEHQMELWATVRTKKLDKNEIEMRLELRNLKKSDLKQMIMLDDPSREIRLSETEKNNKLITYATWIAQRREWGHITGSQPNFQFELTFQDESKSLLSVRRNNYMHDIQMVAILLRGV